MLFGIDAEAINAPEDFYAAISDVIEAARNSHTSDLDPRHLLYLFEFSKIVEMRGSNNSCACIEWPGIQIPQVIISIID
jgi:hypothetical protein